MSDSKRPGTDFTEEQHAILTDLREVLIGANGDEGQFGYDTRELKQTGRITIEEYDSEGEVSRTSQMRVRFD